MSEPFGGAPELSPLTPEGEDVAPAAALNQLVRTIGRHPFVFVAVSAVCVLAALGYLAHRSPTYSASAQILVTPIPATDTSYVGLPLIRAAELEPQRGAATAAPLLASPAAGRATAEATGLTPAEVTAGVDVAAVPDSSLVEVTATAGSAAGATELADAYAEEAIKVRQEFLAPQVRRAIAEAERQRESLADPEGAEAGAISTRIADLRAILRQGDPTLSFARPAPTGAVEGASRRTIVFVAIFTGLVLAGLTTVMIELLTAQPIATEDELFGIYPLPILARIPAGGRAGTRHGAQALGSRRGAAGRPRRLPYPARPALGARGGPCRGGGRCPQRGRRRRGRDGDAGQRRRDGVTHARRARAGAGVRRRR